MKPKLSKPQRKALIFAHELMRGGIDSLYLAYVRGAAIEIADGRTWRYHRHWIEPDQDRYRPYLSEDVLISLVMMGYMETRPSPSDGVWIYRITHDGCDAIGRSYPLYPPHVMERLRDRLTMRRQRELREREQLYSRRHARNGRRGDPRGRHDPHPMPFNYRARKR